MTVTYPEQYRFSGIWEREPSPLTEIGLRGTRKAEIDPSTAAASRLFAVRSGTVWSLSGNALSVPYPLDNAL